MVQRDAHAAGTEREPCIAVSVRVVPGMGFGYYCPGCCTLDASRPLISRCWHWLTQERAKTANMHVIVWAERVRVGAAQQQCTRLHCWKIFIYSRVYLQRSLSVIIIVCAGAPARRIYTYAFLIFSSTKYSSRLWAKCNAIQYWYGKTGSGTRW